MTRFFVALLIAGLTIPALAAGESMQTSSSASRLDDTAWQRLQQLERGSRIRITTVAGAELDGRLSEITADTLSLRETRLRRGDAASVQRFGTVGSTLQIGRGDITAAALTASHAGKWVALAVIVTGLLFVVSPAGQGPQRCERHGDGQQREQPHLHPS